MTCDICKLDPCLCDEGPRKVNIHAPQNKSMPPENCSNCKHWQCGLRDLKADVTDEEAACRRFPPTFVPTELALNASPQRPGVMTGQVTRYGCMWPNTKGHHVCGEFSPRKEKHDVS